MRIAVISDIHGNLEAFSRVLADIDAQHVDQIVSLGDNIGYGADSEEIIQLIRSRNIPSIMGNHELAVTNATVLKWFKPDACKALSQAAENLSEESMAFIRELKPSLLMSDCFFVHGFPPDSMRLYLFQLNSTQILETFERMQEQVCFIGHTHSLKLVYPDKKKVFMRPLKEGISALRRERKYIINAGSVGQPRDGNPNAKYLIWDTFAFQLETRFIAYDVATAANKIKDAGIPVKYALCLG